MRPIKGIFILSAVAFLFLPAVASAQTLTPQQKAALEQELAQVEADRKKAADDLSKAQAMSTSLSRDIAVLDAKIKSAELNIKAKTLLIQTLGNDIVQKQNHIENLEEHMARGKQTLADILRKTNERGSVSVPEVLLSHSTVTGVFQDLDTFQAVQNGLKETFEQLRSDEASTTVEKNNLTLRQNAETDARHSIQIEQANIENDKGQRQQLLAISKGNEKSYSNLLAQKAARAAQIRAQLFSLRDAAPIPFGQALQYAQTASAKTGVRPAFILAVITQESALGANVGKCYVTNLQTGDGIGARTGTPIAGIMSPNRDIPPFIEILKEIGGDPTKQVVSCPLDIGWGGAMGPAQFIPSTWMLMKDEIAAALNISGMPDPWNPAHAFMASAIYLSNLGAGAGTYSAERTAACKYYSGRACGLVKGNTTYGNQVVAKADMIQSTMIDPLAGL